MTLREDELAELWRQAAYSHLSVETFKRHLLDLSLEGWDDVRAEVIALKAVVLAAEQRVLREAAETRQEIQRFYDVTTWLMSACPSGRLDKGATQAYHDALLALTNLRDELRQAGIIQHDESWWNRHLKANSLSSPVRDGETKSL